MDRSGVISANLPQPFNIGGCDIRVDQLAGSGDPQGGGLGGLARWLGEAYTSAFLCSILVPFQVAGVIRDGVLGGWDRGL